MEGTLSVKRQLPVVFKNVTLWDNFDLEKIVELTHFLPEPLKREDIVDYLIDKKYWIKTANDEANHGIGFSIWYETSLGIIEYWLTVTSPEHSKRRIGEKLLKSAIAISRKNNYPRLALTTYNQCHGMIHLCRKLGLKEDPWKKLAESYGKNRYSVDFSCDLSTYKFPLMDKRHTLKIPSEEITPDSSCCNPSEQILESYFRKI